MLSEAESGVGVRWSAWLACGFMALVVVLGVLAYWSKRWSFVGRMRLLNATLLCLVAMQVARWYYPNPFGWRYAETTSQSQLSQSQSTQSGLPSYSPQLTHDPIQPIPDASALQSDWQRPNPFWSARLQVAGLLRELPDVLARSPDMRSASGEVPQLSYDPSNHSWRVMTQANME